MLCAWATTASARDISLGGRKDAGNWHGANEVPFRLPDNVVALPTLVASVQDTETGRWKRVQVDAYLAPSDTVTTLRLRALAKDIANRARPGLRAQPAESLEPAYSGLKAARQAIRLAAQESLGRNWNGDVYIRSMTMY